MRLLSIENGVVFNRTVAATVPDRRKTALIILVVHRTAVQYDGLEGRDPLNAASRDWARRLSESASDRNETVVCVQMHINSLRCVPQLIEGRIEIQVHA